jgi:hypothetical protein
MNNSSTPFGEKYLLNPCPTSVKLYGYKNMVTSSDACYRSCWRNAGILNTGDNTNQFQNCFYNCQKCSQNLVRANQKNPCQVRLVAPPFFVEPNYFKQGYDKYQNVDKAYQYCNKMCDNKDCRNNCFIDYKSLFLIQKDNIDNDKY